MAGQPIFGENLRQLLADAVTSAGGLTPGRLTKKTPSGRDSRNPTAATRDRTENHSFQGVITTESIRRRDTAIAQPTPVLTIIAGTISPVADPQVNDSVTMPYPGGRTYELVRLLQADPAEAHFQFEIR